MPVALLANEQMNAAHSASFRETRAVITQSEQRVSVGTDGEGVRRESYYADIDYDYWIGGQPRQGHGVYFGNPDPIATQLENIQELFDAYPVGTETLAYYDPNDSSVVCLRPGESTGGGWGLAALSALCVLIGVGLLVKWKRSA